MKIMTARVIFKWQIPAKFDEMHIFVNYVW